MLRRLFVTNRRQEWCLPLAWNTCVQYIRCSKTCRSEMNQHSERAGIVVRCADVMVIGCSYELLRKHGWSFACAVILSPQLANAGVHARMDCRTKPGHVFFCALTRAACRTSTAYCWFILRPFFAKISIYDLQPPILFVIYTNPYSYIPKPGRAFNRLSKLIFKQDCYTLLPLPVQPIVL